MHSETRPCSRPFEGIIMTIIGLYWSIYKIEINPKRLHTFHCRIIVRLTWLCGNGMEVQPFKSGIDPDNNIGFIRRKFLRKSILWKNLEITPISLCWMHVYYIYQYIHTTEMDPNLSSHTMEIYNQYGSSISALFRIRSIFFSSRTLQIIAKKFQSQARFCHFAKPHVFYFSL